MSKTKRTNIDKKSGKLTTAGSRNGEEKSCRGKNCSCNDYWNAKTEKARSRRSWKKLGLTGDGL